MPTWPREEWGRVRLFNYRENSAVSTYEYKSHEFKRQGRFYTIAMTRLPAEHRVAFGVQILEDGTVLVKPKTRLWRSVWREFLATLVKKNARFEDSLERSQRPRNKRR